MKPEDQNRTIADHCGWKEAFPKSGEPHPDTRRGGILLPYNWVNETLKRRSMHYPNYVRELDSMHEARLSLNSLQQNQFAIELMLVLGIDPDAPTEPSEMFEFCNATAAKRAEAFIKTIGKWRDE